MRRLHDTEIAELLSLDVVAHLATVDAAGYPHVVPIWFLWAHNRFHVTSYADRPHLDRIRTDPRVGLVIDTEDELRADGERPNKQIRIIGDAVLSPDSAGVWTSPIRAEYTNPRLAPAAETGSAGERVLITITPRTVRAVASV
ncbi:pyridoxamine 5'-phosphate oxidase family protein [Nocardia nova]|uniref:pyridoxamine 5'-phosphate oxidase family protein n=1 Tax=Nocardia nova TaxID=37330 RepID=UPI0037160729